MKSLEVRPKTGLPLLVFINAGTSASGPARVKSLNPFLRNLQPGLDFLQHKRGSQLAIRVQKEKMLASNFRSGRNHRLSAEIGSLELD